MSRLRPLTAHEPQRNQRCPDRRRAPCRPDGFARFRVLLPVLRIYILEPATSAASAAAQMPTSTLAEGVIAR